MTLEETIAWRIGNGKAPDSPMSEEEIGAWRTANGKPLDSPMSIEEVTLIVHFNDSHSTAMKGVVDTVKRVIDSVKPILEQGRSDASARVLRPGVRMDEAERRRAVEAINRGDLASAQRFLLDLATEHQITVEVTTSGRASAFGKKRVRAPEIRTIEDVGSWLHEIGHCLQPTCTERGDHFDASTEPGVRKCLACETDAWKRGLGLLPMVSFEMHRHLRQCLKTYITLRGADWPPSALEKALALLPESAYATAALRRLEHEDRMDQHHAMERWFSMNMPSESARRIAQQIRINKELDAEGIPRRRVEVTNGKATQRVGDRREGQAARTGMGPARARSDAERFGSMRTLQRAGGHSDGLGLTGGVRVLAGVRGEPPRLQQTTRIEVTR